MSQADRYLTRETIEAVCKAILQAPVTQAEVNRFVEEGLDVNQLITRLKNTKRARIQDYTSAAERIVRSNKDALLLITQPETIRSDAITVIQTCDTKRYASMLDTSSKYNRRYCL